MGGESNQVKWRGVQPVSGIRGVWPAIDSLRINEAAFKSGDGIVVIYTVPANKILFIASSMLTSLETAAATSNCRIGVRDASDVNKYFMQYHYYTSVGQLTTSLNNSPALEALAGYDVFVEVGRPELQARGLFWGWLEDA